MSGLPNRVRGIKAEELETDREAYEFLRRFTPFENFQHNTDGGIDIAIDALGMEPSDREIVKTEIETAFRDDARIHHPSAHVTFLHPEPR